MLETIFYIKICFHTYLFLKFRVSQSHSKRALALDFKLVSYHKFNHRMAKKFYLCSFFNLIIYFQSIILSHINFT